MKNFIKTISNLLFIVIVMTSGIPSAWSQSDEGVSIGDSLKPADASAILELFSTTKGFLPPRMTTSERDSINSPATGLVIYDTSRDRLFYYDGTKWKEFSLWYKNNNDIYFHSGGVAIFKDTLTLTDPLVFTLDVRGERGILSAVSGDTVPAAMGPLSNVFTSEFTSNSGYYGNLVVSTLLEGDEESSGVGIGSFIENNSSQTVALSVEASYTGTGATGLEGIFSTGPFAGGIVSNSWVDDPDAIAISVGGAATAESDHKGLNIGMSLYARSDETYANIGLITGVNGAEEGGGGFDSLLSRFPNRLTVACLSNNEYSDSADFNIYASGDAKSYFEGNVGIGTLNPQARLDIAGGVNASAYLVNGDTLALNNAWSQSGDDIYYDNGNVHIGKVVPGSPANLNVAGSFMAVSDTTTSFPKSGLIVSKDAALTPFGLSSVSGPGVGMVLADTSSITGNMDTTFIGFGMGIGTNGPVSNWMHLSDSINNIILLEGWNEENEGISMSSLTIGASTKHTDLHINPAFFSLSNSTPGAGTNSLFMGEGATYLTAGYGGDGVRLDADISGFSATTFGADTMQFVVKENAVGIGTDSPDTELEVNGNIKQKITTASVNNPPTIAQVVAAFGDADDRGDGWTGYLKDDNTDNLYQIMVVDEEWYILSTTKLTN